VFGTVATLEFTSLQGAPVTEAERLGWADELRTSLTVSGWVDSLAGGKRGPSLARVAGTVGCAIGP